MTKTEIENLQKELKKTRLQVTNLKNDLQFSYKKAAEITKEKEAYFSQLCNLNKLITKLLPGIKDLFGL